jgi:O-antigen ligase
MTLNMRNLNYSRKSIDAKRLSIALFATLSFLIQVFTHILASNTLLIIALTGLALLIVVLNKPSTEEQVPVSFLWILAFLGMMISYIRAPLNVNNLVDFFVFFAGISLVLSGGDEEENFRLAMNVIIFFSIFYAVSVWIQILFPAFYESYANLLPMNNRISILRYARTGRYFTGFSSNPGFTAGHIVCGILLLISKALSDFGRREKLKYIFTSIFLMISLFMTGRRAHFVFLLVAIIAIYLLPHRANKNKVRVLILSLVLVLLIFVVVIFKDYLAEIPLFSRITLSIEGLLLGEDITTGRTDLYAHAWSLFLDNPMFGIGWGNFRLSVIGNVTILTEMEVHNIYLQMLCEMGIIGFVLFIVPIISYLILTIQSLRRNLERNKRSWTAILYYSLAYQVFFIFYGLTSNPLYDPNFLMMYFLACAITTVYLRFEKADRIKLVKRDSIKLKGTHGGRSACID